jgi:hypothetical protein
MTMLRSFFNRLRRLELRHGNDDGGVYTIIQRDGETDAETSARARAEADARGVGGPFNPLLVIKRAKPPEGWRPSPALLTRERVSDDFIIN